MADFCLTEMGQREVEANQALACHMMKKYRTPYGLDDSEWYSEVMECLMTAVAYWSPAKGTTLSALLDRLVFLRKSNLNSQWRTMRRGSGRVLVSLDASRSNEDGLRMSCGLGLIDKGFNRVDINDLCDQVLSRCSERGRLVLNGISQGRTLPDIGSFHGFSTQYASQVLAVERRKLIEHFPDEVNGCGKCKDCGGPMVQMSRCSKPKRCPKCAHAKEVKIKKKAWKKNERKWRKSNAG